MTDTTPGAEPLAPRYVLAECERFADPKLQSEGRILPAIHDNETGEHAEFHALPGAEVAILAAALDIGAISRNALYWHAAATCTRGGSR